MTSSSRFAIIAIVVALPALARGVRGLDEGVGGSVPGWAVFNIVVAAVVIGVFDALA